MSADERASSSRKEKKRKPSEEFYRLSKELKSLYGNGSEHELDSSLKGIFDSRLPLGTNERNAVLRLLLLGSVEYTGAQGGALYSISGEDQLSILCRTGIYSEIAKSDWGVFFKNIRAMLGMNDLLPCTIHGIPSLLLPLRTGIGAQRQFIFFTGIDGPGLKKGKHLSHSPQFRAASNIVKNHLLIVDLLKDSENGLLNGNSFFRIASLEFEKARLRNSPLAIATLLLRVRGVREDVAWHSISIPVEELVSKTRKALKEREILTIHNPELFIVLFPTTSKNGVEETYRKLVRTFEEQPVIIAHKEMSISPHLGVAYYDGESATDFSELLMALSEAFDLCLNKKAQFVLKQAGEDTPSKFVVSEEAAEILFQSLDHNKLLVLYKISQIFGRVCELKTLFNQILDLALSAIGAERGLFCIREGKEDIKIVAGRNTAGSIEAELSNISQSIIAEAMKKKRPIFSQEVEKDKNLKGRDSIISFGIRSVLCMPLIRENTVRGALYLDIRTVKKRFSLTDLIFLKAFSHQAVMAIENTEYHERREAELRKLRDEVEGGLGTIVGQSSSIRMIMNKLDSVKNSDITVLIEGENGSGKELFAKAIYSSSQRKSRPFLTIDCSSISATLIESELFGHAKGAFTGARTERTGLFEAANGGTVFLDEIDSLDKNMQGKLLRVIEEGEIRRIGENAYRKVDVRVITSTKKDLRKAVMKNEFREDLFYRLNVFLIQIPPLRERREDIPLLASHFLKKFTHAYEKQVKGLSQDALEYLLQHSWPGNVRELRNVIERSVVNARENLIRKENLSLEADLGCIQFTDNLTLEERMGRIQRQAICDALAKNNGNITAAARILDISRRGLQKLMNKHEVTKEQFR